MKYPFFSRTIFAGLLMVITKFVSAQNDNIHLFPDTLSATEIKAVVKEVENTSRNYDSIAHLIKAKAFKHYHSDLDETYTIHNVLQSFNYAVALLDTYQPTNYNRAFEVLKACLSLQDANPQSKTFGVWPYFQEEPFATKKSPPDRNWADFCSVRILRILNNHYAVLPEDIKVSMFNALINATKEIKIRDIKPDYTNICLMGLHVCYMTAIMYNDAELLSYSKKRLQNFYECTLLNKGFIEYNSPAYTKLALDEIWELKKNVSNEKDHAILDSIYNIGWGVVAKHYHKNSAQWAGPHGRAYSVLTNSGIYNWLYTSSNGLINPVTQMSFSKTEDHILKHRIPGYLLPYFLNPKYPRLQLDTFIHANQSFEINPMVSYQTSDTVRKLNIRNVIGKSYLTSNYVISSINKSSLWDQRRPIMAYWGSPKKNNYMRVRLLHNMIDYAAANVFCDQDSTHIIGAINFTTNGGDTHVSIDAIKNATIKVTDFRLRFEFGGNVGDVLFAEIDSLKRSAVIKSDRLKCRIDIPYVKFDEFKPVFSVGSDGNIKWVDLVIYNGEIREINFNKINEAVIAFMIAISDVNNIAIPKINTVNTAQLLTVSSGKLKVQTATNPYLEPISLLIK
ncbi:MAG: hypothetical protein NTY72_14440 [Bacteroidetes bacterium]|nr:hypothetical protein [Bacteroidota bacterium]